MNAKFLIPKCTQAAILWDEESRPWKMRVAVRDVDGEDAVDFIYYYEEEEEQRKLQSLLIIKGLWEEIQAIEELETDAYRVRVYFDLKSCHKGVYIV